MAETNKKIKKPSGLKSDGTPNAYWRKFKERLDSYDSEAPSSWKAEDALAHILRRYRDYTGSDFSLSYSGPPTKCKEMFCVRRMIAHLGTEDGNTIKNYIDWIYDKVIIDKNMDVESMAFFFHSSFISKFKAENRKKNKITRATLLSPRLAEAVQSFGLELSTYGDLAFAKMALDNDPEDNEEYKPLFVKLDEIGFNEGILDRLET